MTDPSKEYLYALVGESYKITKEGMLVKMGFKKMTTTEKEQWNERKDFVQKEIKRVMEAIHV